MTKRTVFTAQVLQITFFLPLLAIKGKKVKLSYTNLNLYKALSVVSLLMNGFNS